MRSKLLGVLERRRATVVWLLSASLLTAYSLIPEGDDTGSLPGQIGAPRSEAEPRKLTILDIAPSEPAAGSVVTVSYEPGAAAEQPELRRGKQVLRVLASRPGSLVAQLPDDVPYGAVRLRLVQGGERSKTYELHVKPFNWQKLLRNACGGLALLMLGVYALARGVRGVLSVANMQRVAALTRSRLLLLAVGTVLGAGMQSITAAAGLLAGAVGSRVVSITAAASLLLGAQLGTALAPWLLGSITEPRSGLMAIAVGGLALTLALDKRSKAVAQLLIGGGLVAFGVQVLRPGFEPFASNPMLLAALDRLSPEGFGGACVTVLLGALLVAIFQGPALVLALALGIAETTGHENLRTTLVMLTGTGLGAGLSALLILPGSKQSRRLVQLSVLVGMCNTLISVATIDACAWLAKRWTQLSPHIGLSWGKHSLPDVSWQIAAAFALSQIVAALLLLPLLPYLEHACAALRRRMQVAGPSSVGDDPLVSVRNGLVGALDTQTRALPELLELAVTGTRSHGVNAERCLKQARDSLLDLLRGPVAQLAPSAASVTLGRLALSAMQLQSGLEQVLRAADQLTESRLTDGRSADGHPAGTEGETTLRRMHELLHEGLTQLIGQLRQGSVSDADDARAREIAMNRLEARTRRAMLSRLNDASRLGESLPLLAISNAYEVAGNQLYRMAEVLEKSGAHGLEGLDMDIDTSGDAAAQLLHARNA